MTKATWFTFASIIFVILIAFSNLIPSTVDQYRCVDAKAVRSHYKNSIWQTEFEDENGNLWSAELEERPHLYDYVLIISDNSTPYDVTDDVIVDII